MAASFVRKSLQNFRSRGRSDDRDNIDVGSDEEDRDVKANANDADKDYSSAEECSSEARQKKCRRSPGPQSSPARTAANSDIGGEEYDNLEPSREKPSMSLKQAGDTEILARVKEGDLWHEKRRERRGVIRRRMSRDESRGSKGVHGLPSPHRRPEIRVTSLPLSPYNMINFSV